MRQPPTGSPQSTLLRRRPGLPNTNRKTLMVASLTSPGVSWRCSASTRSRAGSKVTRSQAATASSPLTKPFVHVIEFNVQPARQMAGEVEKGGRLARPGSVYQHPHHILVWRQDHNGFTHQDPGFLDVVTNKSADVVRIYLPPDANCLLSVTDIACVHGITST